MYQRDLITTPPQVPDYPHQIDNWLNLVPIVAAVVVAIIVAAVVVAIIVVAAAAAVFVQVIDQ